MESDFCGLAQLIYSEHNITINRTIALRRHDDAFVFSEMMEEVAGMVIPDDRLNARYILTPIRFLNERGIHTFIFPLNYTVGNVVRYGCLNFYTADGKQQNKCRDKMMPGVILDGLVYPTFPKLARWKCATAALENRVVIEESNVTLYSRLNNKSMIVIPGDDIVVVNTLPPEVFNKMSYTVKNSSALMRCIKMKMCLIRNLTTEKHVYTINSETLAVKQLTKLKNCSIQKKCYTKASFSIDWQPSIVKNV
jgi:hypothetical protein